MRYDLYETIYDLFYDYSELVTRVLVFHESILILMVPHSGNCFNE